MFELGLILAVCKKCVILKPNYMVAMFLCSIVVKYLISEVQLLLKKLLNIFPSSLQCVSVHGVS